MNAAERVYSLPNIKRELSREDVCAECARVLGLTVALSIEEIFSRPLIDFDVFEDESMLINRLYYTVPAIRESRLELFVFFEENRFLKDKDGELILIESSLYIQET